MKMYFSEDFERVTRYAADEAMRTGHTAILPDHLILGILRDDGCDAVRCLASMGIDPAALKRSLDDFLMKDSPIPWENRYDIGMSPLALNAANAAIVESQIDGARLCGSIHLLAAILKTCGSRCREILSESGIDADAVVAEAGRLDMLGNPDKALKTLPAAKQIADELERGLLGAVLSSAQGNAILS